MDVLTNQLLGGQKAYQRSTLPVNLAVIPDAAPGGPLTCSPWDCLPPVAPITVDEWQGAHFCEYQQTNGWFLMTECPKLRYLLKIMFPEGIFNLTTAERHRFLLFA
ncbi:hypothetical protein BJX99DRAFT_255413 [Aspergillus californicus]